MFELKNNCITLVVILQNLIPKLKKIVEDVIINEKKNI